MFTALLGFISPWLGSAITGLINYFQKKQDNAHELDMLKESNASKREIAQLDDQVGMARADVDDVASARAAAPSYGAKLLDAVSGPDQGWIARNIVRPILLLTLTAAEVANSFMRPWVIYLISGMWASAKLAKFYMDYQAMAHGSWDWHALGGAALVMWEDRDYEAFEYVLGFLLGSRHQLYMEGKR